MADSNNSGQFGNRDDTEEQAQKGGQESTGQFGSEKGADPREAQANQPREAQVEGGEKGGSRSQDGEDNE